MNDVKIPPAQPFTIKPGDEVEVGKPVDDDKWKKLTLADRFIYKVKVRIVNCVFLIRIL